MVGTIEINGTGGIIEGNLGTAAVNVNQDAVYDFDGVNDYIDCGNGSDLQMGTGDFSFGAWIKRSANDGEDTVISYGDASDDPRWYIRFNSGTNDLQLVIDDTDGAVAVPQANTAITDTLWHHVFITLDRSESDGAKMYIDGVLDATGDQSASSKTLTHSSDGILIGARRDTSATAFFNGNIRDV